MPRDTLTRDQIVRTAVELLDEDGLEGLNMRSLGKRLDSAATAVYWHVKNKDDLVALAGDAVWHEIDLPELDATHWRAAAVTMAESLYGMLTRHPWLVLALGSHLFTGEGKARHDDHNLAVYERAGFIGEEADQASATVFMFVLGNALGQAAQASLARRLNREGGNAEEVMRATLAEATEIAMRFPRLRARLEASGSASAAESVSKSASDSSPMSKSASRSADAELYAAPENSFAFGLATILDGLERRLT